MSKPCDTCESKWKRDGLECEGQQYCNETQEACGPYTAWKAQRELVKEIQQFWINWQSVKINPNLQPEFNERYNVKWYDTFGSCLLDWLKEKGC